MWRLRRLCSRLSLWIWLVPDLCYPVTQSEEAVSARERSLWKDLGCERTRYITQAHLRFCFDMLMSGRTVALVVRNPPANAGGIRDVGLIPVSGRSSGVGNSNPLQYFCLENPMDRGAWWVIVHRVAKSWIWMNRLMHNGLCHILSHCWPK